MRNLKKFSIHEVNFSAQPLSRERMKAIKGGGGNCYIYCAGYNSTRVTIASYCNRVSCDANEVKYCSCS